MKINLPTKRRLKRAGAFVGLFFVTLLCRAQTVNDVEQLRNALAAPASFDWTMHELTSNREQKIRWLEKICAPYEHVSEDTLLSMLHASGSVTLALGRKSDPEVAQMMVEQLHLADMDGDLQNELVYDGDNPLKPGSLFILYKVTDTTAQEIFFSDGLLKHTTGAAGSATFQLTATKEKVRCGPWFTFQSVTFQSGSWKPIGAQTVHSFILEDVVIDKGGKIEKMKPAKDGCKRYDMAGASGVQAYTLNGGRFKPCPRGLLVTNPIWSLGQTFAAGNQTFRLCLVPAASFDPTIETEDDGPRPSFELVWIDEPALTPFIE